ncbi:uncharacterized protein [Oscarella lobularis]
MDSSAASAASDKDSTADLLIKMMRHQRNFMFRYKKFGKHTHIAGDRFSRIDNSILGSSFTNYVVPSFGIPDTLFSRGLFSGFDDEKEYPKARRRLSEFASKYKEKGIVIPEIKGEFDVHRFLAKEVIYPLTGCCWLSKHDHGQTKTKHPEKYGNVKLCHTGLGDEMTWHGSLDMISKVTVEDDEEDDNEDGDQDDGSNMTPVAVASPSPSDLPNNSFSSSEDDLESAVASEVKLPNEDLSIHMPQVSAQVVVWSFVRHHRHPDENPLVPAIIINMRSFRVVMYDCLHDVFLELTDDVPFLDKTGKFNLTSIAYLWVILHHSMFLAQLELTDGTAGEGKSGFLDLAESLEWKQHYIALKHYHKTFTVCREKSPTHVPIGLPADFLPTKNPRKRKRSSKPIRRLAKSETDLICNSTTRR